VQTSKFHHATLNRRQQEVASMLSRTGLSYKEVAARLKISVGTMRKHVENVYRKFGVHSRWELTMIVNSDNTTTAVIANDHRDGVPT